MPPLQLPGSIGKFRHISFLRIKIGITGRTTSLGLKDRVLRFIKPDLMIHLNLLRAVLHTMSPVLHTLIQLWRNLIPQKVLAVCFREVLLMLKVIAQDFIRPEAVDIVMPLYRELVEKTKQEKLCIAYDLFVDQKDPGHFIFVEEWPDRAALDAHCATEHFTRLVPLINQHQRQEGTFILMDGFDPAT
jgi:quinol monooxygenase YgiN